MSLETLRENLEVYFKLLKNAMIELINKDYADFVNLSSNLVSFIFIYHKIPIGFYGNFINEEK